MVQTQAWASHCREHSGQNLAILSGGRHFVYLPLTYTHVILITFHFGGKM